ncbi:hypothetical protein PENTCL1PPCAC_21598, partial [Pristionchus entomophagus]
GDSVVVDSDLPISCTRAHVLDGALRISVIATAATMLIAPVLSIAMVFRKTMRKEPGVTAFIFLSSLTMAAFAIGYFVLEKMEIPEEYRDQAKTFLTVAYLVQDFRFPILCLLATLIVGDIRGAVFSTITRSKLEDRDSESAPDTVENPAYSYLESFLIPHNKF